MRRWSALAIATLVFGCGESSDTPSSASSSSSSGTSGTSSGSTSGDDERIDPFCSTRPRLSFCEDFDDSALPGRFQSVDGTPSVTKLLDDAPSVPNVLTIDGDARLTFDSAAGIKFNLFFLVKVAATHGRIELAGFDDGTDHFQLGVEATGNWFVVLNDKKIATTFAPKAGEFSSVRFDIYVDTAGAGHLRFRSGEDMVFEKELVTYTAGKAELKPRWFVGAKHLEGPASQVQLDSITLGDD